MRTTLDGTSDNKVSLITLAAGLIGQHDDGRFRTVLFGFAPGGTVELPANYTHFGVIVDGNLIVHYGDRERRLKGGDFFCVVGPARVTGPGVGMVNAAPAYRGLNVFGGPLEATGRLRYIDGCSDTLLVPPVRKGDPCLNHLHFPLGIRQTPHTHPSVRTGLIYRGAGECVVPGQPAIPLRPGSAFIIATGAVHSFNTYESTMDVIAFHPDSDTGMTDDDHPMINRTIVDGVSARLIEDIRTVSGPS